ncbi:hypothetical protein TWF281_006656 [Arthrobotrys megalospora]
MRVNLWAMQNLILLSIYLLYATVTAIGSRTERFNEAGSISYRAKVPKRQVPGPEATTDQWVFVVRPGYGKDPAFEDIDEYIISRLGSNATTTKNNKVFDPENGVAWFYAQTSEEAAWEIMMRWNQTISTIIPFGKLNQTANPGLNLTTPTKTAAIDDGQPSRVKRVLETWKARPELCALSKAPGAPDEDPCEYITDSTQGSGVTVYIIGSGANIDHEEFEHLDRDSVAYIFADPQNNNKRQDKFKFGQAGLPLGTAVLSKLCGTRYGVAKQVTPVIVKVTDPNGETNILHITQGLMETYTSIVRNTKRNPNSNFIVIHTTTLDYYQLPAGADPLKVGYEHIVKQLSNMRNVILVTGAEVNQRAVSSGKPDTYLYPAILGRDPETYPNLLVVGGVDTSYKVIDNVGDWVKVYAPAKDIAAAARSPSNYLSWDTVALAVPAVAGLLATFMSKGKIGALEARSQLELFAYKRGDTKLHRAVAYNAVWEDVEKPPKPAYTPWDDIDWDAEFCRLCTAANGVRPINDILWIPGDCPCKTRL